MDAPTSAPPPASIRAGLATVLIGAILAAVDLLADTVVTVRLVTHTLDGSKLGEFGTLAVVRLLIYAAAIAGALVLRGRTRKGGNRARIGLIALLCLFIVGGVANLVLTWVQLLGTAMGGGDYGRPVEPWLNYTALGSLGLDVVLLPLALIGAITLTVGRAWTHPAANG